MIVNIILIVLLVILVVKYKDIVRMFSGKDKKESFDIKYVDETISDLPIEPRHINSVLPHGSTLAADNITSYERLMKNCEDAECARIDNYRHKFFEFNDRINHNTHLHDSVDNINITNKAQDYMIGKTIANIYDDLVNSNEYKDGNVQCRIITPDR